MRWPGEYRRGCLQHPIMLAREMDSPSGRLPLEDNEKYIGLLSCVLNR